MTAVEARPNRTTAVLALVAVFAAAFLAMIDLSISAVATPAIRLDLTASISAIQWVFDAYTLCFASLVLVGGLIGDRLGHRTGLVLSLTLFMVGSALCAFAPDTGLLIAGRAVQGTAAAMLVPSSMALIAVIAPEPERRAKLLGIWSGLSGAAIALGPVFGGWLVHISGWRLIFLVNLPLGALVLALTVITLPRTTPNREGRIDFLGLLLGAGAAFSVAFGVIEGNSMGWTSPVIIGSFVTAVVAAVAFVFVELRSSHPMMPVRLFRSVPFAAANVINFVLGFALSAAFFFLSQYLQQVLGYSALGAGLGFLPAALGMMFMAPLAGQLAGRLGSRALISVGLALGAGGLFSLSLLGTDSRYVQFWWAVALVGVGLGLALPPNTHVALGAVEPERAGAASGTIETSLQFGTVVGIAALGTLQASTFLDGLRGRLADAGLTGPPLSDAVDKLSRGEAADLPGLAGNLLDSIVKTSFAEGLQLAFLVASVVTAVTVLVALFGAPKGLTGAAPAESAPAEPQEDVRPDPTSV
ncbi:MFS transporter [Micromonospora sp. C31]|uniref:MFS transporter n=1 Tax=Micromonospora sp. C31 TaxID=2824876 RepID=UPI001B35D656|nr:MFS transporter [Micromonospora sp. C31]MBQ1075642.1 MFS transporter [Micromonospora sp. C31]